MTQHKHIGGLSAALSEDPRKDCPWKCRENSPECLCRRDNAKIQDTPKRMDNIEKSVAAEWKRCIISAGADENVAQQAVTLAALNGLFDHRNYQRSLDRAVQQAQYYRREAEGLQQQKGDYPPGDDPRQEGE